MPARLSRTEGRGQVETRESPERGWIFKANHEQRVPGRMALTHFRAVVGLTLAAARLRPVCPWADERPAARTKLRLVPVQAGPDALDVRNLGDAQAKRVACTRLSPLGRVGMAGRRPNRDRKRRCQHQTELEIPGPDGKHGDRSPQAFIRELWVKDRGLARCRRPPRQRPRHQ